MVTNQILLFAAAIVGVAQDAGDAPLNPVSKWRVDQGTTGCGATRTFGANGATTLKLFDRALTGTYIVSAIVPDPIIVSYNDPVRVTLAPSGRELQGRAIGFSPILGRPTTLSVVVDAEAFSTTAVSAIRISTKKKSVAYFAVDHLPEAVAALNGCKQDLLSKFGIDPAEQAAVATPPKPLPGKAVGERDPDYPIEAMRANATGSVTVRFRVSNDGSVTGCAVLFSSGNAALDKATCAGVARARFSPALSKDGQPVPSAQISTMDWGGRVEPK